jgi:hypothetical protein
MGGCLSQNTMSKPHKNAQKLSGINKTLPIITETPQDKFEQITKLD